MAARLTVAIKDFQGLEISRTPRNPSAGLWMLPRYAPAPSYPAALLDKVLLREDVVQIHREQPADKTDWYLINPAWVERHYIREDASAPHHLKVSATVAGSK